MTPDEERDLFDVVHAQGRAIMLLAVLTITMFVIFGAALGVIAATAYGDDEHAPHHVSAVVLSHRADPFVGVWKARSRLGKDELSRPVAPRPSEQPPSPATVEAGDPSPAQLARLRWCESGRDGSDAVSSSSTYRGAYQFDLTTWRSVGGHGDPARASLTEQTRRAVLLYRERGWQPWPVCGRWLR